MAKYFITLFFILSSMYLHAAPQERSDTIDIRDIVLHLDITDFPAKVIQGKASIKIQSLMNNISAVNFDLEGLTVDSVLWNSNTTIFNHLNYNLNITAGSVLNISDTAMVDIYYHGTPISDATWGGFYFIGNYAFNMGVGFNAQPHNFGRVWHPCFDNFVERSPYEFFVRTTADKKAICNGLLIDSVIQSNTDIIWHYKLNEEIPSYLSSLAVSNYYVVQKALQGMAGVVPATIACPVTDTNKVNGSFAHLQESFSMLEQHFGQHSFPKVGYTLVPFNGGAMEHPTNIHIGSAYINGNLAYETLIAHELTHHWWGDLVTCQTAGDMWLNEGFASYGELLHLEYTYDYPHYIEEYRNNHFDVINSAHIDDQGYKAISPMDSLHTYGKTVYDKGADVLHTLRTYLGDSLFFTGLKQFLNQNKFRHINSQDLRNGLNNITGKNLNSFFDDWIFQPGFPHYSIDSSTVSFNGSKYQTRVYIRHRKHKANHYYNDVPVEIGFYDENFHPHIYYTTFNGRCMEFFTELNFDPKMIIIDPQNKLSDAVTENQMVIQSTGNHVFNHSRSSLYVKSFSNPADSSLIRIEHSYIPPDRFKTNPGNGFVLNNVRYWKVDGIHLGNLNGLLEFKYNGSAGDYYIDSSWIRNAEDSIRLFYRKDAGQDWVFANDSLVIGSPVDKRGKIYSRDILAGEYCLGIRCSTCTDTLNDDIAVGPCSLVNSSSTFPAPQKDIRFFPNPVYNTLSIECSEKITGRIVLYTIEGKVLKTYSLEQGTKWTIALPELSEGIYLVRLIDTNRVILKSQKIFKTSE